MEYKNDPCVLSSYPPASQETQFDGYTYSELVKMLRIISEEGSINLKDIYADAEMKSKQKILAQHTSIWYAENDDTWNTHIRVNGKRKLIKRKRKEDVEEKIVQYYRDLENNPTVGELYHEWMTKKLETKLGFSKQSADRYDSDHKRFFEKTGFSDVRIKDLTSDKLEDFVLKTIHDEQLTRRQYGNLHTIIKGILKYARKKKLTDILPDAFFADLDLDGAFREKWIDKEAHIFRMDEIPLLKKYFLDRGTIWDLGCLLCLETGLRVGELAALRHEDWNDRVLKIRRSEKKIKDATGHWKLSVEEYPKTEAGNRNVILTNGAIETLQKIVELNPSGDYLFQGRKGQRIRGNTFNKRITTAQQDLGMRHRSIHKARASYGTVLLDGGCDDSTIQRQMGHKDINTTRKFYYFSNKAEEEQRRQVESAIKF